MPPELEEIIRSITAQLSMARDLQQRSTEHIAYLEGMLAQVQQWAEEVPT